jgi:hypothetical protein
MENSHTRQSVFGKWFRPSLVNRIFGSAAYIVTYDKYILIRNRNRPLYYELTFYNYRHVEYAWYVWDIKLLFMKNKMNIFLICKDNDDIKIWLVQSFCLPLQPHMFMLTEI